jgi:acetylornithine deacetylase/succinyl-diaminopimelate desuccinylase-like protein
MMRRVTWTTRLSVLAIASGTLLAQTPAQPDWTAIEAETMQHFQGLLRLDTSSPPGNEKIAVAYLVEALKKEGIDAEILGDANRPNLVARLKGNGTKRPLLIMGHTDVVNVDPTKWTHPPFSATRNGGYVYGRGAVDDKDNLTASLMTILLLKRLNVPLDRDVIFLAESGEEGGAPEGITYMVNQQFPKIEAEYCLAEGGGVTREGGQVKYASVQTTEKIPRAIELTATGIAGHASVPLQTNALIHLSRAIEAVANWKAPIHLNETTASYFRRLAQISSPEMAARYADVLDPGKVATVDEWFKTNEPRHAALLHTTATPTIIDAGYRVNVIPSEAKATIDVRTLPDEDPEDILALVRKAVNNPAVKVEWGARNTRPAGASGLTNEAFTTIEANVTRHYAAPTLPTMSAGATDMAQLRAKGVQCYGIGPAIDTEDGPKGFGAHSDQERILESELHRFVRFQYDIVLALAGSGL